MSKLISLEKIIAQEHFIQSPLLPTDQFITDCRNRSVYTSRNQLEQFEKLGLFYPIARVKLPKIKHKVEYKGDGKRVNYLGLLEDGEKWQGDIREEYASF